MGAKVDIAKKRVDIKIEEALPPKIGRMDGSQPKLLSRFPYLFMASQESKG